MEWGNKEDVALYQELSKAILHSARLDLGGGGGQLCKKILCFVISCFKLSYFWWLIIYFALIEEQEAGNMSH